MNTQIKFSIILMMFSMSYMFYYFKNTILSFILMNLAFIFIFVSNTIKEYKKVGKISFTIILSLAPLLLQFYLMYRYLY